MRRWGCGAAAVICRLLAVSWRGWELILESLASVSRSGSGSCGAGKGKAAGDSAQSPRMWETGPGPACGAEGAPQHRSPPLRVWSSGGAPRVSSASLGGPFGPFGVLGPGIRLAPWTSLTWDHNGSVGSPIRAVSAGGSVTPSPLPGPCMVGGSGGSSRQGARWEPRAVPPPASQRCWRPRCRAVPRHTVAAGAGPSSGDSLGPAPVPVPIAVPVPAGLTRAAATRGRHRPPGGPGAVPHGTAAPRARARACRRVPGAGGLPVHERAPSHALPAW